MPRLALALMLATACAATALAQEAVEPKPLKKVVWEELPTEEAMQRAYPKAAFEAGVGGKVVLACKVLDTGRLDGCSTRGETPAGQDFGAAAMALAPAFRMRATTEEGLPTAGGFIRIPIQFDPPPVEDAPAGYVDKRGQRVIRPLWLRKPSGAAVASAYPEKALARGVGGKAILSCVVTDTGHVDQCKVIQESPPNLGFGRASIRLAQFFVMQTDTADGVSTVGATVIIPLSFSQDFRRD